MNSIYVRIGSSKLPILHILWQSIRGLLVHIELLGCTGVIIKRVAYVKFKVLSVSVY